MAEHEETGARVVLKLLREYERTATRLSATEGTFEPITRTDEFPDGSLTVTIARERGEVTIAFYDPAAAHTIVMTLEQLRQRIADL